VSKTKDIPTKDYLNNIFNYENGNLYWKEKKGSNATEGKKAGCYNHTGYFNVEINYIKYRLHRVIFMWHHGFLPQEVDHINGNKIDNRIENLRASTKSQNLRNSKIRKTNTSGYKNVTWRKDIKKWSVSLRAFNKNKHIGFFENLELAGLVAAMAREKYHKEFAKDY
jgi:hypothetical protein